MPHEFTLIATIAAGFVFAFVFGFAAVRLRLPPLVGYLMAGVVIGRFAPGSIADTELAGQLAEVGVILLMFGVGMHFSVADLMAVRGVAVPGAIIQIGVATAIGTLMAQAWGWGLGGGVVLGLCLSVASTVVLLKALEETNAIATTNGRIAVGWLIVEDLAMVLVLVLLPAFAGLMGGTVDHGAEAGAARSVWVALAITIGKMAAFVALVLAVGPRVVPWILKQVARTGSRELFTLSVLAVAIGIAFGSAKLFGVSFALGAFFAGVVLNESELSHKAAANSLPLQDAFAVLFFVSVGMLFDPTILVEQPLMVAAVLLLILIGKTIAALCIVWFLGFPASTALTVAASLAQIGEFSFILIGLGTRYHLVPIEGLSLVLAGALLSITLNQYMFAAANWLIAGVRARPAWRRRLEENRQARLGRLEDELRRVRERLEQKAAAHKTFSPDELVQRFPLFASLTLDQREALILHFHRHSATPGQRVIRAGDRADSVYFIARGEVEIAVARERIKLGAGGFFGEMALLTGKPRNADVTAIDFCEFLTLDQRDFHRFLRRYPDVSRQVTTLAAEREENVRRLTQEQERTPEVPAKTDG
jgi:CPA2 family monovalent cation:H+ antiporter-2